jgi:hypothetical protein
MSRKKNVTFPVNIMKHKKETQSSPPTHVPGDASSVPNTTYILQHVGDVLTDTVRAAEHSLLRYHLVYYGMTYGLYFLCRDSFSSVFSPFSLFFFFLSSLSPSLCLLPRLVNLAVPPPLFPRPWSQEDNDGSDTTEDSIVRHTASICDTNLHARALPLFLLSIISSPVPVSSTESSICWVTFSSYSCFLFYQSIKER